MNNFLLVFLIFFLQDQYSFGQGNHLNEIKEKCDLLIQDLKNEAGPGGVVLLSKAGEVIYQNAFGKANIELDIDMKSNHVFNIASNGKPFTAIAILKLYEDGLLSLQDDIKKYIPYYPTGDQKITIEHLLTHTSGIPDITRNLKKLSKISKQDYTEKEYIEMFCDLPKTNLPGTKVKYSNSGYFLLGLIIEKASHLSYDQYLRKVFFEPLGMKNTVLNNPKKIVKKRTSGYSKIGSEFVNATYRSKIFLTSGQGAYMSTVQDLNIWYNAIFNNEVISKETLGLALKPFYLEDGSLSGGRGYVWPKETYLDSVKVGTTGLTSGFASSIKFYPKEKILSVGLLNCNTCAFQNDFAFYKAIHRLPFIAMKNEFWSNKYPTDLNVKKCAGIYKSESDSREIMQSSDNKLYLVLPNGKKEELYYIGDDYFLNQENFEHLKFIKNTKGKIVSLESLNIESQIFQKQFK